MSMLRSSHRRDALEDAVHLHSARREDDVIFGHALRSLRDAPDGLPPAPAGDRQARPHGPADLDELCPDWREREHVRVRPQRPARRADRALGARGRPRPPVHGALPARSSAAARRAKAARSCSPRSGAQTESDGAKPILVAGEEAGLELPFGCREGICHTCIGKLCSGRVRDLRNGKVYGSDGEMVRTCISAPEGADRDRTIGTMNTMIESPLARLSEEQIDALGRDLRPDARRGLRVARRPRPPVHRRDDRAAPPPRRARPRAAVRIALQGRLARRHDGDVAGQDPREHGDRPQRPARPVGLDERPPDPLVDLGLGHGIDRRGVEALPQLHPPHLHEHPRQGQGPRLRDHADRPASEVAPGLPAAADLQRAADAPVRVGRGVPRPRPRGAPQGREAQGGGASRSSRASPARRARRSSRTTSRGRW